MIPSQYSIPAVVQLWYHDHSSVSTGSRISVSSGDGTTTVAAGAAAIDTDIAILIPSCQEPYCRLAFLGAPPCGLHLGSDKV